MDAPRVEGVQNDVTSALNQAITGGANCAAHVIHWVVVADTAFEDGERELIVVTAPGMPSWMIDGMLAHMERVGAGGFEEGYEGGDDDDAPE